MEGNGVSYDPVIPLQDESFEVEPKDVDQFIEEMGFGRFQIRLLFLSGLIRFWHSLKFFSLEI